MKRCVIFVFLACVSCVKAQVFTLHGHITGQDTGTISLSYTSSLGTWVSDRASVRNGNFVFTGRISGPTPGYLLGKRETKTIEDPHLLRIFLEPDSMDLTLPAADFHKRVLIGSTTQDEMDALDRKLAPLSRQIGAAKAAHLPQPSVDSLKTVYLRVDYEFVATHPHSYLSPDLLYIPILNKWLTGDAAKHLFFRLDTSVQKSDMGKRVSLALQEADAAALGAQAHDFTLPDLNKRLVRLSDFKGKRVVLLDFWASWSAASRTFTPHLKEIFQQYQNKGLSIVAISEDKDSTAWVKAVSDEGIGPFYNVRGGSLQAALESWYSIGPVPTYILIDKNGIIAGRYLSGGAGSEADLDKKLSELLGK